MLPPGPAGPSAEISQLLNGLSAQANCGRGARLSVGVGVDWDGRGADVSSAICASLSRAAARQKVAPILFGIAALRRVHAADVPVAAAVHAHRTAAAAAPGALCPPVAPLRGLIRVERACTA